MSSETDREEMDMLAAEYALRLLEGEDLARANALMNSDQDFVRAVEGWTMRLTSLAEDLAPVDPAPSVKRALMRRMFPAMQPTKSFWDRVGPWLGVATAASVALAAALAWQVFSVSVRSPGPLYTAEIASDTNDFRVVAVVDKTANEVFLTRTAGAAPEGRILQVWAHGEGAPAQSVGLWPEGASVRLVLPPEIAAVEGTLTLGVSEEPPGGSPTGAPTGRVFGTADIPNVSVN